MSGDAPGSAGEPCGVAIRFLALVATLTRNRGAKKVEVVGRPDLPELAPGWRRLARRAGRTPLQDAPWCLAAADTVDADGALAVVVAGDPADPVAIAPLVRRRGRLELLGAAATGEPGDLLYEDATALEALLDGVAALRRPLLLNRLPEDSPVPAAVAAAFRRPAVTVQRPAAPHAAIALDPGWTAPEGQLSSRRAGDIRRARRRAEAAGGLEVELLAPAPDELDAALGDAFAIEARSWKGRSGTALAADAGRAAFFRAYAGAAARAGELRLAFLRVGGRRVAMHLSVEFDRRLWLLKIGHDEALARCSPGSLLLLEVVRDAAARGLRAVQMLGGIEPWTRMWTESELPCVTVAAYPPGVASLRPVAADAATVLRSRLRDRRQDAPGG